METPEKLNNTRELRPVVMLSAAKHLRAPQAVPGCHAEPCPERSEWSSEGAQGDCESAGQVQPLLLNGLHCSSFFATRIQKKHPLLEEASDKNIMHHKRVVRKQVSHFLFVLCFNDHQ